LLFSGIEVFDLVGQQVFHGFLVGHRINPF